MKGGKEFLDRLWAVSPVGWHAGPLEWIASSAQGQTHLMYALGFCDFIGEAGK